MGGCNSLAGGNDQLAANVDDVAAYIVCAAELAQTDAVAVGNAAQRITAEQLEDLRAIIREAESETAETKDVSNITEYFDTRFHSLLYQAAGNQKLMKVLQDLHIVMLRIWFHVGLDAIGFAHQAQNFYEVLEALEQKDPEKARTVMEDHVDLYAAQLKEKFL